MNPTAHRNEDNAKAPVLYMALELSNKSWRLAFGDGTKRRQALVPAADLVKLAEAIAKAKERFKMPAWARVVSCYEAGRDGFWLHRHLRSIGIQNEVIDAASIEVNRRLRHVKTDRLDGDRLLDKRMRYHAGQCGGWSVVRVPSIEEEDARRLHLRSMLHCGARSITGRNAHVGEAGRPRVAAHRPRGDPDHGI